MHVQQCSSAGVSTARSCDTLTPALPCTALLCMQASHAPSSAGLMWTTIGLCWAMFVLALAMAITTMVLHAADCCAPDSPFGLHSGPLALCAEVLCVAWLVRWLTGDHSRCAAQATHIFCHSRLTGGWSVQV